VREDWFRKRGGKGASVTTKVHMPGGSGGQRKYFVLTERYLDWFETPKGQRKGSLALDNIYVRIQPENNMLIVGTYGRPREFKMIYEGSSPQNEVRTWYDALNKTIEDYKKKEIRIRK